MVEMDDVSKLLGSMTAPTVAADSALPTTPIQALAWLQGSTSEQGNVTELSRRDVKVVFSRPLKLGSLVEFELSSALYGFSVAVHGLIHWCEPVDGKWVLGAFLNQDLPENVISHCWSDLRKELRYDCRWDCALLTPRDRRDRKATLLNYSRSGAMIQSARSVPKGEDVLVVDPESCEKPALVRGIVRWVTNAGNGDALLGCEFPEGQGSRLAAYLRTIGAYAGQEAS
jgi:hypothetical protein